MVCSVLLNFLYASGGVTLYLLQSWKCCADLTINVIQSIKSDFPTCFLYVCLRYVTLPYLMLRYAMLPCVRLRHVTLCCVTLCNVTLCYVMLRYVLLCYVSLLIYVYLRITFMWGQVCIYFPISMSVFTTWQIAYLVKAIQMNGISNPDNEK